MSYKKARMVFHNSVPGEAQYVKGTINELKSIRNCLYKVCDRYGKERRLFKTRLINGEYLEVIRVDGVPDIIDYEKFKGLDTGQSRTFTCANQKIKEVRKNLEDMGFKIKCRSSGRWEATKL